MEIVFLGNWSAKTVPGKSNTSFVIDGRIVCDFGPTSLQTMLEKGIDPNGIEQVLISHLHYDHFAGVVGLLWYRAMSGNSSNLRITGPEGIGDTTRKMLEDYETPQGFHISASFNESNDGIAEVFKGDHTVKDYAYRISYDDRIIFYTGDTAFSSNIVKGAEGADLLIHEMTYTDSMQIEAELWKHSTVSDALETFKESRSKRLIPVHLTQETYDLIPALQRKHDQLFFPEETLIL